MREEDNQEHCEKETEMKNYYVTNEEILPEIKKLRETGVVSEKLGEYFLRIARNLANKGNFSSYT